MAFGTLTATGSLGRLRSLTGRAEWALFVLLGATLLVYYFSPNPRAAVLGAAVFALLAFVRLDLALVFVVFSAPFYRYPKSYGALEFSLAEFAVLTCFVAWLLRGGWRDVLHVVFALSDPARAGTRERCVATFSLPVVFFGLVAATSLFVSQELKVSLREYRVVVLEPIMLYVMLVTTLREERDVWRFLNAFVALGTGMAVFGLYHYFFVGMVETVEGVGRMLAIYHSPNALGLFLGRVAPVSLVLATAGAGIARSSSVGRPMQRAYYALSAAVILICLFFTFSRGAWFGVAVAMLTVTALQSRRLLLASVGAVAVALAAASPFLWQRLVSWDTSLRRLYVWLAALDMWRDHPLLGVGLDNFLYRYPDYMRDEAAIEPTLSHPHNLLLDYATRLGVLGLLSLFWLQATFWRGALRLYGGTTRRSLRVGALALMASMMDFLAHGFVDNSYFLIDLAFVFWLTTGLLAVMITCDDPRAPAEPA